jgi:hypothetical protein
MAKKFVTQKELDLIDSWSRELIQDVVVQEVVYYAVHEDTSYNFYREAIKKVWYDPVKLTARVQYDQTQTVSGPMGNDAQFALEVYCHIDELRDRNLKPREGDFVEYDQVFYEITTVSEPQQVFGQANAHLMVKLTCTPAREGQFSAGSVRAEGVDNSHPVNPSRRRKLEGS